MKRTISGSIRVRNELRHLQLAALSVKENDSDWGVWGRRSSGDHLTGVTRNRRSVGTGQIPKKTPIPFHMATDKAWKFVLHGRKHPMNTWEVSNCSWYVLIKVGPAGGRLNS